jgi:hypothetical protein
LWELVDDGTGNFPPFGEPAFNAGDESFVNFPHMLREVVFAEETFLLLGSFTAWDSAMIRSVGFEVVLESFSSIACKVTRYVFFTCDFTSLIAAVGYSVKN